MPYSCRGVSFTVAMVLSCKIAVRAYRLRSYGFVVPDSCAGVSLTVAMAVRAKAVRLLRIFAPKL